MALAAAPSLRRWLGSPALFAGLAVALAIFAPFVAWNAAHGWATFAKQFGRAPPHNFAPFYIVEFLISQVGLINPLVFAALASADRERSLASSGPAALARRSRRVLVCTIAPAAVYFLLHSTHDRVQGNWLAPLYPAAAILAADWVAEVRRAGAPGFSAAIAKMALWAAPVGLAFAALAFVEALTGAVPLGPANPLARLEGFRALARDLDAAARADGAAYVLTQGYALTSLMSYYGDRGIAVVQPEQRMRWIFEPSPPETLFGAPGLALGERAAVSTSSSECASARSRRPGCLSGAAAAGRSKPTNSTGSPIPTHRCWTPSACAARSTSSGDARRDRRLDQPIRSRMIPARITSAAARPLRVERLAERRHADDRREHDRRFAKRRDRCDRGAGHRPDDDRITEKGGDPPDETAPPVASKGDGYGASAKTEDDRQIGEGGQRVRP